MRKKSRLKKLLRRCGLVRAFAKQNSRTEQNIRHMERMVRHMEWMARKRGR